MNYYKRHLGDYAKDAGHLTMLEHGAYNLLIDRYYSVERPIQIDEAMKVCRARSSAEREAVESVLREFFSECDSGFRHNRCDEEIAAYNEKANRNRELGKMGGRPRKTETQTVSKNNPNGFQNETERVSEKNPSHKPLAISQERAKAIVLPNTPREPNASEPANARGVCVQAAIALRAIGKPTTPQNPDLIAASAEGVTVEELTSLAELYPGKPASYVIAAARRQHAEGAKPVSAVSRQRDDPSPSPASQRRLA